MHFGSENVGAQDKRRAIPADHPKFFRGVADCSTGIRLPSRSRRNSGSANGSSIEVVSRAIIDDLVDRDRHSNEASGVLEFLPKIVGDVVRRIVAVEERCPDARCRKPGVFESVEAADISRVPLARPPRVRVIVIGLSPTCAQVEVLIVEVPGVSVVDKRNTCREVHFGIGMSCLRRHGKVRVVEGRSDEALHLSHTAVEPVCVLGRYGIGTRGILLGLEPGRRVGRVARVLLQQFREVVVQHPPDVGLIEVVANAGEVPHYVLAGVFKHAVAIPVHQHPEPIGLPVKIAVLSPAKGQGIPIPVVSANRCVQGGKIRVDQAFDLRPVETVGPHFVHELDKARVVVFRFT